MGELTQEDRKKKKLRKYRQTYKNIPEKKRIIADPLIDNAAFMEVELEDLQKIITENGASEEYKNGENQYGKKQSADLQAYNSLVKSYNAVNQRLEAMLPKDDPPDRSKLKELMQDE